MAKSGAPKDTDLTTFPSDTVLARQRYASVARTPTSIRKGEIVALDKTGKAIDRRQHQRAVRGWMVAIYGGMFAGPFLMFSGMMLSGLLVYAAAMAPLIYVRYRGSRTFTAIEALAAQGHLEEAQRRLDKATGLRRRNPLSYAFVAGILASHRGDHEDALRWYREAEPRLKPGLPREIVGRAIVVALVRAGRIDEAAEHKRKLVLAPTGDPFIMGHVQLELMIGLHTADPARLPSVEQLHTWASGALAYSHTGPDLAMLGWAFELHGDDDMADFLAREAPDRMHYPYLARWWPELQRWLDARLVRASAAPDDAL